MKHPFFCDIDFMGLKVNTNTRENKASSLNTTSILLYASLILILNLVLILPAQAAEDDSLSHRNVLKANITAPLLWGSNNYILEYERVVHPSMSASIGMGYRSMPKLVGIGKSDSALVVRNHINHGGFSGTLDLKFYPKNENKYPAPRGFYYGPFISFFSTNFKNEFSTFYKDFASLEVTSSIRVLSAGIQLGYQFMFWKRFSLDISFFGPALSWYHLALKGNSNLSLIDQDFFVDYKEQLLKNYPVISFFADDISIDRSGNASKLYYGYRYYITLGVAF